MNVWLMPDLQPFVGGTYFPPEDSAGRHGFKTILSFLVKQVGIHILSTVENT